MRIHKPPIFKFDSILLDLCAEEIELFSKLKSSETFYGFAITTNSNYGQVDLAFNSLEALEESASGPDQNELEQRQVNNKMFKELNEKSGINIYSKTKYDDSPEFRRNNLKWSVGDWKYSGLDEASGHLNSSNWEKLWSPISSNIEDEFFKTEINHVEIEEIWEEEFLFNFMSCIAKVVKSLEVNNAFKNINKTHDFKTLLIDHSQSEEQAFEYMKKLYNNI
jgi:hypothetical protein